jgi:hypothetical protein
MFGQQTAIGDFPLTDQEKPQTPSYWQKIGFPGKEGKIGFCLIIFLY